MRCLQNITDIGMKPQLAAFSRIPAVDQDLSFRRFEETADQIDQRALAGTGLADDRYIGSLRHCQIEVLQHHLIAVGIAETDIAEFDIAFQRFPVPFLRIECIAVLRDNFRCICNIRFRLHQSGKTFDVDLNGDQSRNRFDDHHDRLHHIDGIVHKD